jgi:hypothetical protein
MYQAVPDPLAYAPAPPARRRLLKPAPVIALTLAALTVASVMAVPRVAELRDRHARRQLAREAIRADLASAAALLDKSLADDAAVPLALATITRYADDPLFWARELDAFDLDLHAARQRMLAGLKPKAPLLPTAPTVSETNRDGEQRRINHEHISRSVTIAALAERATEQFVTGNLKATRGILGLVAEFDPQFDFAAPLREAERRKATCR